MPNTYFSHFQFDACRNLLINSEQPDAESNNLRHKVAQLLGYLIEHRERVISKDELLENLWQQGDYRENSLTQSIRELRLALGDNAKNPTFIKTYPQRGYQWICPLQPSEQAPASESTHSRAVDAEQKKPAQNNNRIKVLSFVAVSLLVLGVLINSFSGDKSSPIQSAQSLLVLPFINATNEPSMAWLELGLSDMLAIDMQRSQQLHVTPPAVANALLLDAELDWPTLPAHISSLLRERELDAALQASVRLHNDQQVLDFQLIYRDGRTQQGSISYPSLPADTHSIGRQLLLLLQPETPPKLPPTSEDPIAAQALAKGMQALQQAGPLDAHRYFQASLVLQEDSHWARAYLAYSHFSLGGWLKAENLLTKIPLTSLESDASLDAFVHYSLAEIAYRRGSDKLVEAIDLATQKAEATLDTQQMARSYRLQAALARDTMQWQQQNDWLNKANRLLSGKNTMHSEAEKLFYLGNPSSEGLEKNPQIDLESNQAKLLQALNFYQQLGNQAMIAASQLAIAQNYTFALEHRAQALERAIALYQEQQLPYELAQTLLYEGFYLMQLHQGQQAEKSFLRAKKIATELGAQPTAILADFYLAFAALDQGLDQSEYARHGTDKKQLQRAVALLHDFIATDPSLCMRANAEVFLGWAYGDLKNYDAALAQLISAKETTLELNMMTTFGYSSYSIMRLHLFQKNYDAVIAMAHEPITTRLQAVFLARAYYENKNADAAIRTLNNFRAQLPHLWQPEDNKRLAIYQAARTGSFSILPEEPLAHGVYCESDWNI